MLLASAGSDVLSQLDRFKESFLWAAAKGGRVEECEMLVQMGTDIDWVSPGGDTPLLAACRNGHVPAAMCLLLHGAAVNLVTQDGQTALHLSCRKGNEALAEALIQRGANPSAMDNRGTTPFEGLGPHVPTGMLRRLSAIGHRTRTQSAEDPQDSGEATPSQESNFLAVSAETLTTLDRRIGNKESRRRRRQNRAQQSADAARDTVVRGERVSDHDSGRVIGEGNTNLHVVSGAESQSSRRVRGSQGARVVELGGGGLVTTLDSARRTREPEAESPEIRTTFPAITATPTASATSRRGTPAESQSSRDGRSNSNRPTQSVVDDALIARALGEEELRTLETAARGRSDVDNASSSGSCISSDEHDDEEEEEIFERGQCPAASLLPARHYDTLENDERGREERETAGYGPHRDPSSGSVVGSASARRVSVGQPDRHTAPAIVAALVPANSPTASRPDHSTSSALEHLPPPYDATMWEGAGIDGSRPSRGFYFGQTQSNRQTEGVSTPGHGLMTGHRSGAGGLSIVLGAEERTEERADLGSAIRTSFTEESSSHTPDPRGDVGCVFSGFPLPAEIELAAEAESADDHVSLVRMLWLQEKEKRLAAEAKAEAVRDQSARLWNELVRSEKQVLSLEEASASVREERDKLCATLRGEGIKGRPLQDLEQLEKDLRKALDAVCSERDRVVQDQLVKEEQRLCVVCQEKERGVLLLPCRHLCVCKDCSERQELTLCPLCRDSIAERLAVYS